MCVQGTSLAAPEDKTEYIYVSPDGSDTSDGSVGSPLATLDGARKKVRSINKKNTKIEVVFRGGDYRFTSPVSFTSEDSGISESVVYRAYDGEEPVFKGSVKLDNPKFSKVTDKRTLKRIKDSVKDKIAEIDLSGKISQNDIRKNTDIEPTLDCFRGGEPNALFIDGKEQRRSEWPNGDGNYTRWLTSTDGRTITYEGTNPIYWTEATDWWVGGYHDWDWRYSRMSGESVDPVNKTITVTNKNDNFKFTSYQSRRWKAFNLLEEIDVPGEYYIDRSKMKLYLYPPYSLSESELEISLAGSSFMNITGAENITFSGITFSECCADAIKMQDVKNIDFLNCTFKNLGAKAIYSTGSKKAQTDADYWQNQRIDGSYNCDISGCTFYNIGADALDLSGGNLDTLTPSGNVIENNIFYLCARVNKEASAVFLGGCGFKFIHNNMSRIAFRGLLYRGNDMEIMYNEMHDCIQETDDCGIIYAGRNAITQGNVIAYNYLHDSYSTEALTFGHQCAIYWDDRLCGQSAYNNIIKDVNKNIYTNGVDDMYCDNLSINVKTGDMDIKNGGAARNSTDETSPGFGSIIANPEIYFAKYKNLKEMFSMMDKSTTDPALAKFSVVTGNLAVNSAENIVGSNTKEYGVYKNNEQMEKCDDFVDAENQDYRLKSGSPTAKKMPKLLDDTFDIEQIGLQTDLVLSEQTSPFRQLYPQNGQSAVSVNNLEFVWEDAFGASKYHLKIATDRQMKNVVYDEIVPYSVKKVDGLEKNRTYYWSVSAVNRSRELGSEWGSTSPVFSFTTGIYEKLNTDYYNNVVSAAKQRSEKITEGDKPGEFKVGTKNTLLGMIKNADAIKKLRFGSFPQNKFDALANRIGTYFSNSDLINKGALDFGDYIENDSFWSGDAERSGKEIILSGKAERENAHSLAGVTGLGHMAGSVIYCFDAKFKVESGLVDIGLNKNIASPQWIATNTGYSLVIKPDCIELQRATGSVHSLLKTVDYAVGDSWHSIEYGFINIGVANLVILNIDGKNVIEYCDVDEPISAQCNFCMLVYNTTNNSITLRRSEKVMTDEQYLSQFKKNAYQSAKSLLDSIRSDYNERVPFIIFKDNAKKIINEERVIDVSSAPVTVRNGEFFIPVDKLGDILGSDAVTSISGSNITLTQNGESTVVAEADCITINGIRYVSAQKVLSGLKRGYVKEESKGLLICGNIVTMNNTKTLNNISTLIDYLELFGDNFDVPYEPDSGEK